MWSDLPKCGCKPKGFYTDKDKTVHPVYGKHAYVPSLQRGIASLNIPKRNRTKLQADAPKGLNTGSALGSGEGKNMSIAKSELNKIFQKEEAWLPFQQSLLIMRL